jgi:hypothetical protein
MWTARGFTITLPAISGYAGLARVILRATDGGVEEKNLAVLELEFTAAGAYVLPRPNTPQLRVDGIAVTGGLTAGVTALYDPAGEKGVATKLQLFTRTPSGSYNYAAPADEENLAASGVLRGASLSKTFAVAGWYYLRVLAATAAGVQSDPADAPERLLWVSAENLPAPAYPRATVSRG